MHVEHSSCMGACAGLAAARWRLVLEHLSLTDAMHALGSGAAVPMDRDGRTACDARNKRAATQ